MSFSSIKLSGVLLQEDVDLSALNQLDDLIKKDIEDASKQSNEAILTIAALALAIPGIIKSIDKIVQAIFKKQGIDLTKKQPGRLQKVWNTIVQTADQIDRYLDTPFERILRPFVKNSQKREKIAKVLKALTLATMAILSGVDLQANAKEVAVTIQSLAPEVGKEILQAVAEKNGDKLALVVKSFIQNLS